MKHFITISAPSGSGKTTLCRAIQNEIPDINWSVSYTTRDRRDIEKDGIDYNFISAKDFDSLIVEDYFIEWENVHGFYYGTAKSTMYNALENDKILLMEMDVKGAMKIKQLFSKHTFSIFIAPPSINHLRDRLRHRGTDSKKRIEVRLKRFKEEMEFKDKFDYVIINEELELARKELIYIINKQRQGVMNGS